VTYSQLRPDQNNKASSLTNFFRNWGGSFGIALITTVSERRQALHQTRTGDGMVGTSSAVRNAIEQTTAYLRVHGFSQVDAMHAATARVYEQLAAQTRLLGFMDCFFVLGVMTLAAAPLVWATQNFRVAGKAPEAH
jgi:DHA2 family multidrug resistance protein